LSNSSHFPPMLYSNVIKPVMLPPGRARLSTMPPPIGSPTTGNTIGMVRVAWSIALEPDTPWARMTSGADAASSVACLRSDAGLVVAERVSMRRLRPMVQPDCCKPCRNAPTQPW
jgi:hypothetical protein